MRKYSFIFFWILFPLILSAQTTAMTYNLRYDNPNDKENWWEYRKAELVKMIKHYHPDILGIQEGLNQQVKYLDSSLNSYDYAGVGRDDGMKKGEYSAIFYDTAKFFLLSTKTYWLSQTPDIVSVGWDAALERIATFGKFRDKNTGDTLYVFNCHMDHIGKLARENSAKLIIELIDDMKIGNKRLIVMGDFNAEPNDVAVNTIKSRMEDMYGHDGVITAGPAGTFNAFNIDNPVTKRIDYIFVKNIRVIEYIHVDDRRSNNLWLSDHLPVLVKMKITR
jgi:endonuclease/exonuclease/phosphatase family metal-dependent hydrolase